jgi:uncharacterized protein (DUF2336 family)
MVHQNLFHLQELARDKTPAGRQILTTTIGDLFFEQSDVLTQHERELMGEILRQLIREVETSVRRTLARRLASVPTAPRDVVIALANDAIDVAQPLLTESTVLGDPELIDIIRNRTQEHQLAIAVRMALSEQVSDALIKTNNANVIATLLENGNARISSKTIEYLVEQSERIDAYHKPLLTRQELTPPLAARMYGWVSAALKAHILAHYPIDPLTLAHATDAAVQELSNAHPVAAKPTEDVLAEQLDADHALLPPLIVQALRDGEIPLFLALFGRFTGVPRQVARQMLFEPRGEGLCIACKASGIDRSTFASIYLLSRKARLHTQNVPLSDMAGILALYDRVSSSAAATLLKKWQQSAKIEEPPAGSA